MKGIFTAVSFVISLICTAQVPAYVSTVGLVGYWPFSGNANDLSGNGNNGTVNGASLTADRNNVAGEAYFFDGMTNNISIANSLSLNNFTNNAISVAFWGKVITLPGGSSNAILLSKQSGSGITQDGFNVAAINSDVYMRIGSSGGPYTGANTSQPALNVYHHYVFTWQNNIAKAYFDNVLVASTAFPSALLGANSMNLLLGQANWSNVNAANFHGVIDELLIWDREISACEVEALYTSSIPSITIPVTVAPTTICAGQSATLTTSVNASYSWSPGGNTQSLITTPLLPGTYTYSVSALSATSSCIRTGTGSLFVNALPSLSIVTSASAICSGSTVFMFAAGADTYTWNTPVPGNAQVVTPTITSSYSVMGTNTVTGCLNMTSIQITVNPLPTLTLANTSPTICEGSTITLQAGGADSYTWNGVPGSNTLEVFPANSMQYVVEGSNTLTGCTSTNTVSVIVNQIPIIGLGITSTSVCFGPVNFTLSGADEYSVNGQPEPENFMVIMSTNTVLAITATNTLTGCTASDTIPFTVFPLPQVSISGNSVFCLGSISTLTANGANSYTWGNTSTNSTLGINPAATTIYFVYGENSITGCGNGAVFTVNVFPSPTVAVVITNSAVCQGNTNTLTANGADTYVWNTGHNAATYIVSNPSSTSYTVTGTSTLSGCSSATVVQAIVHQPPNIIVLASSPTICSGTGVTLNAVGANTYTWNGTVSGNSISSSPSVNTVYTVVGESTLTGCVGSASQSIQVIPSPTVSVEGKNVICINEKLTLSAHGAHHYLWNNNDTARVMVVTPATSTLYFVTGTDSITGCNDSAGVNLKVEICFGLSQYSSHEPLRIFPNPANSVIYATGLIVHSELMIFDSAGKIIWAEQVADREIQIDISRFAPGIYLIRHGERSCRLLVSM